MDILPRSIPNNYDEVRGRTSSPQPQLSRTSSMSLTKSLVIYHERMEHNNHMNNDIEMNNDSTKISYKTHQEQAIHVSKATDPHNNTLNKYVMIKCLTLNPPYIQIMYPISHTPHVDDCVINIQLLYDLNTPTEPELWDGNFHPISLHSSIEYLASDSKNIKNSLNFMAKYISNKQVDSLKSNNLEDFNSIGEAIWNFIFSIYQSKWNSLITDKNSNTLR